MIKNHTYACKIRRHSGKWWLSFLLLAMVAGAFLAACTTGGSAQNASTSNTQKTGKTGTNPPIALTADYKTLVKEQIAQRLKLSVDQVKRKLQTETDLFYVASDQQIAGIPDSVIQIELNALKAGDDKMVSNHTWTQQQANQNIQYWQNLGNKGITGQISNWFRE